MTIHYESFGPGWRVIDSDWKRICQEAKDMTTETTQETAVTTQTSEMETIETVDG